MNDAMKLTDVENSQFDTRMWDIGLSPIGLQVDLYRPNNKDNRKKNMLIIAFWSQWKGYIRQSNTM